MAGYTDLRDFNFEDNQEEPEEVRLLEALTRLEYAKTPSVKDDREESGELWYLS